MPRIYGQKDSPVVFSLDYCIRAILTVELSDKNTKSTQKVRIGGDVCHNLNYVMVAFTKRLNGTEVQQYSVSDIHDQNKKIDILCGKGALEFRIENMKFVERDILKILSITRFISKWYVVSVISNVLTELTYKINDLMKESGIPTEKTKSGQPRVSDVSLDASVGDGDLHSLVNTLSEGVKPNAKGNGNGNTNQTETAPAGYDELDEMIRNLYE